MNVNAKRIRCEEYRTSDSIEMRSLDRPLTSYVSMTIAKPETLADPAEDTALVLSISAHEQGHHSSISMELPAEVVGALFRAILRHTMPTTALSAEARAGYTPAAPIGARLDREV